MIVLKFITEWLQKNLRPPSAFSSYTLILLSIFSWFMSWLANGIVENLLANLGWIFLIFGTYWATTATKLLWIGKIPLSPWITGALVSIYIFGWLTGGLSEAALICWPLFSAIIAAIPDFLGENLQLKSPSPPKRQDLVILFGTQLLLSSWFQFYFILQNWVEQYPSVLADEFNQSAFVWKVSTPLVASESPRGIAILNAMEPQLKQRLNGKPWSEVERLLLEPERVKLINSFEQKAKQQIGSVQEDELWQVKSNISRRTSGYNLQLQAIWDGPRSKPQPYSVNKSCQITQAISQTTATTTTPNNQPTAIGQVVCERPKGWGVDSSIAAKST
ncbi:MAG TPA: DUF5357 family protein [Coleofasciculaceae cyanobacterium]